MAFSFFFYVFANFKHFCCSCCLSVTHFTFSRVLKKSDFCSVSWQEVTWLSSYPPQTPPQQTPSVPPEPSSGPGSAVYVMSPSYFIHVDVVFGWPWLETGAISAAGEHQFDGPDQPGRVQQQPARGRTPCIRNEHQVCQTRAKRHRERRGRGQLERREKSGSVARGDEGSLA